MKEKINKALTWEELADIYGKITGRKARIQPLDTIFKWAKKQTKIFHYDKKEGTLHKILK